MPSRLGEVFLWQQEGLLQLLKFRFEPPDFALQAFQVVGVLGVTDGADDRLSGLALLIAERLDERDGFRILPAAFGDADEHCA